MNIVRQRERLRTRKRERLRERFDWTPEWAGSFERYALKLAHRSAWRVSGLMGPDDLYQEFAVKFVYLTDAYPGVVDAPHFMALFKTTCARLLHDLASKRRRKNRIPTVSEDLEGGRLIESCVATDDALSERDLMLAIEVAPEPIRVLCHKALAGKGGYQHPKDGKETRKELLRRLGETDRNILPLFKTWAASELGLVV